MHQRSKRFFEQMEHSSFYKVRKESTMLQVQFKQKIKCRNYCWIIKHGIRKCNNYLAIKRERKGNYDGFKTYDLGQRIEKSLWRVIIRKVRPYHLYWIKLFHRRIGSCSIPWLRLDFVRWYGSTFIYWP